MVLTRKSHSPFIFFAWSLFVITILAQCPNSKEHGHGHSHDHGSHGHAHAHDDHAHGHSHDHPNEPASFKYSKQANTPPAGGPAKAAPSSKTGSESAGSGVPHRTVSSIWIKALISTFAISCAPLIILFFIRVDNTERHKTALEYLLSFASGGLLGDAFLHLIPHAVMEVGTSTPASGHGHGHGHGHSHGGHGHSHGGGEHDDAIHTAHIGIGAWVLSGILAFLLVEVIMRAIRSGAGIDHGHSHSHDAGSTDSNDKTSKSATNDSPITNQQPPQKKLRNESEDSDSGNTTRRRTNSRSRTTQQSEKEPVSPSHVTKHKADDTSKVSDDEHDHKEHSHSEVIPQTRDMRVAAYLNLAADFAHNFTDGLAVGAGFLVGDGIGIITAVTVILHEIPHEIGDYAILLKAGCSPWKAIGLQLVTAIGAVLGTILSLGLGASSGAVAWILPFTAGGFIYIATVSVLPELLDSGATLLQAIGQMLSLMLGVALMAVVCLFE